MELYLVTDSHLCAARPDKKSLLNVVLESVRGQNGLGASLVQLREKNTSTRDFLALAKELVLALAPFRVPLLINDRADIALASHAAGLHIGQSDLPPLEARELLGPEAIIGLSVDSRQDLLQANALPPGTLNYVAVSPVFATPTKGDTASPWGLAGLSWARQNSAYPLVAIGGINLQNTAAIIQAGADSLAVVSALISAAEPALAAAQFRAGIRAAQQAALKKNGFESKPL